jgi:hypothetical protein
MDGTLRLSEISDRSDWRNRSTGHCGGLAVLRVGASNRTPPVCSTAVTAGNGCAGVMSGDPETLLRGSRPFCAERIRSRS